MISITAPPGREILTAARTYYVRSDGSDSNTGLADSAGGAFLTWQKAYDVICATLDTAGYTVTIKHGEETGVKTFAPAAGTNLFNFNKIWDGGGALVIEGSAGDLTTPSDLVFSTTNVSVFYCTVPLPNLVLLRGFKATTTGGYSGIVEHYGSGGFTFNTIECGACNDFHFSAGGGAPHITATGAYTINGAAPYHVLQDGLSIFNFPSGGTVTVTGTPAFTSFVRTLDLGAIFAASVTFSGSATGKRYEAEMNGVIQTYGGGANYFPGNAAGSTATGGQYA
jgi:hypothetical protein